MGRLIRDGDGWKRKRKMQSGAAKSLQQQEDILFQILTRLGAKSLIRFKLACKSWMALITDPLFINSHLHLNKSNPHQIVTLKLMRSTVKTLILMDEKGRVQKSCFPLAWQKGRYLNFIPCPTIVHHDGLFLIGRTAQCLVVCNPATREVVTLPPTSYVPNVKESGVGIGFDRATNRYKVVRIFYRLKGSNRRRQQVDCGIEVITLGAAGNSSWRQKVYPPSCGFSGDYFKDLAMVTVQGAVYWKILKKSNNNSMSHLAILRFDLSSEEFTVIDPPDPNKSVRLVELRGRLYCYAQDALNEDDPTVYVWLLNDNLVGWTLLYTIRLQDPSLPLFMPFAINDVHLQSTSLPPFIPIAIDREGCMLFKSLRRMQGFNPRTNEFYFKSLRHMHCYNPRTNQFYEMGNAYDPELKYSCLCYHITSYVETIVPISSN